MNGFLQTVLEQKQREVAALHASRGAGALREAALEMPPCRDLLAALRGCPATPVIAEVKKASPSLGDIAPQADPAQQARLYERAGASACSVLCDGRFFKGSLDDLSQVRAAVGLPLLAKDFHIDEAQLAAARLAGADAALLIAALLPLERLAALYAEIVDLGMAPLVEVHKASELTAVLPLNPPLVGINNRNLDTLAIDLATSEEVRPLIPKGVFVISESGVQGPDDVRRLLAAGCQGFLVGSALMSADDPALALAALCQAGGAR